ncbi:MAG: hypothetical protein WCX31_20030 [Salinivirgaceae bacterium]|jgi:hypothetical protein
MKTNVEIEQEIKKTMESLTDYPKATTNDFFYTRLSTRLEKPENAKWLNWFFDSPFLKPAFAILFLALNLVSLLHFLNTNSQITATQQTSTEIFVEEYLLNQSTDTYLVLNEE